VAQQILCGKFTSPVDVVFLERQRVGWRVQRGARRTLRHGQQIALGGGRSCSAPQTHPRVHPCGNRLAGDEAGALVYIVKAGTQWPVVVRLYHSLRQIIYNLTNYISLILKNKKIKPLIIVYDYKKMAIIQELNFIKFK